MLIVGLLMTIFIWGGLLVPLGLAVYGLAKWRGGWRFAAAVPLIVSLLFFAPLVPGWIHDPTSHNLWGLAFIPVAAVLFVYSVVVIVKHRRSTRRSLSVYPPA